MSFVCVKCACVALWHKSHTPDVPDELLVEDCMCGVQIHACVVETEGVFLV